MRILGVGHCTLDHLAFVERFPEPDFKTDMMQFSMQGGGSAATAIVALARWGVETEFMGKVGDDERGAQIVHTIRDEGVDTKRLIKEKDAISQLSFIVIEAGTARKQTYVTEGSVTELSAEEVPEELLDGVDYLIVDGSHFEAELKLMRAAKERGIKVVLDASQKDPHITEAVAACDYLIASERFASQFAGVGRLESLCHALLERGPETVVVTLGDEGCVAMSAADRVMVRENAVEVDVVDTTGAGDIFHGAFIYGLISGWDLAKQVRFANAAAGLTCRGIGGRGAIPTLLEIDEVCR